MPPPYTSDQELAWRTLASEIAEAIYSGEVPGREPQLDGVSMSVGGGGERRGGGTYKTQTVKGVGVASPEKETGRGLLIAVVIASAIVDGVLRCRTVRGTSAFIGTWGEGGSCGRTRGIAGVVSLYVTYPEQEIGVDQ